MTFKFRERIDLFAEYRGFYADDVTIDGNGLNANFDFQTSNVFGGIRLKF